MENNFELVDELVCVFVDILCEGARFRQEGLLDSEYAQKYNNYIEYALSKLPTVDFNDEVVLESANVINSRDSSIEQIELAYDKLAGIFLHPDLLVEDDSDDLDVYPRIAE